MTAIRDRENDLDDDAHAVSWDERAIAGDFRGLPWWGAVALGFGLAFVGAAIDLGVLGKLGLLFKGCYFAGAVAAVCWVRRKNLFGPMVQPPLVLAVTVPGVVLLGSGFSSGDSDTLAQLLDIVNPLINGFPTMAVTTAVTVVIGAVRLFRERDPEAGSRAAREPAAKPGRAVPPPGARKPARRTIAPPAGSAKPEVPAAGQAAARPPTRRPRRDSTPPPPGTPDAAPGGRRAPHDRARPLDPLEPGAAPVPPRRRQPRDPGQAPLPPRETPPPGGRRRAEDPAAPRRAPLDPPPRRRRDATPPPPPVRGARPEPGEQPPRRGPARKPPGGARPWELEDRD